jgi:hypothetical protein
VLRLRTRSVFFDVAAAFVFLRGEVVHAQGRSLREGLSAVGEDVAQLMRVMQHIVE